MELLADLHVHSNASPDGLSGLPDLISAARKAGLDAIAICDHNLCTPLPPCADLLLIPSCEVSTQAGHITGLFLDSPLDLPALTAAGLPTAQDAIAEIHRRGGVAVLAHPFQKAQRVFADYDGITPDAIETINARANLRNPQGNQTALAFAQARRLPFVGGSDAHAAGEVGNAFTRLTVSDATLPALKQALLDGQSQPELHRLATHRQKGASQFVKAKRSGSLKGRLIGIAYYVYCLLLDGMGR